MDLSVVVKAREDGGDAADALLLARVADGMGFGELWVGEGPTWDAFALATAIGLATGQAALTVGPVPVSVRDPATISRGAASVSALIGRPVGVALGTASVRVVEKLHGRSRARAVSDLGESARAIRSLIEAPSGPRPADDPDEAFLARLAPPSGPLTVAAFGDRAIAVAAASADRMLLDLVSPAHVAVLRSKLVAATEGRPLPRLAAWLPAAVEPGEEDLRLIEGSIVGYLGVAGYREMFEAAGFERAVEKARAGAPQSELLGSLPPDAAWIVGLVGSAREVTERLGDYQDAGLDEIALVPANTGGTGVMRTLTALRDLGASFTASDRGVDPGRPIDA